DTPTSLDLHRYRCILQPQLTDMNAMWTPTILNRAARVVAVMMVLTIPSFASAADRPQLTPRRAPAGDTSRRWRPPWSSGSRTHDRPRQILPASPHPAVEIREEAIPAPAAERPILDPAADLTGTYREPVRGISPLKLGWKRLEVGRSVGKSVRTGL